MEQIKNTLKRIEAKLDRVIKAMQDYDGVDENFEDPYDEYRQYKASPCVNHDTASWEEELKEKVVKASREFGKKKAAEVREQLKGVTIPKPKKKYHKPKKKKNETIQNNSNNSIG